MIWPLRRYGLPAIMGQHGRERSHRTEERRNLSMNQKLTALGSAFSRIPFIHGSKSHGMPPKGAWRPMRAHPSSHAVSDFLTKSSSATDYRRRYRRTKREVVGWLNDNCELPVIELSEFSIIAETPH